MHQGKKTNSFARRRHATPIKPESADVRGPHAQVFITGMRLETCHQNQKQIDNEFKAC